MNDRSRGQIIPLHVFSELFHGGNVTPDAHSIAATNRNGQRLLAACCPTLFGIGQMDSHFITGCAFSHIGDLSVEHTTQ